jgi:glutathione peroxidase
MPTAIAAPLTFLAALALAGSSPILAQQPPAPPSPVPQPAPQPVPEPKPPARGEPAPAAAKDTAMNFYTLKPQSLEGKPTDLAQYRGKVTLVVNVASECGYTPQYAGLEELHTKLKDKGFAVLGFPSNDFGAQEPGTPEQIRTFCTEKYHVDFPLFAKVQTKAGEGQSEVYALLGKASGKLPRWNFGKYLVGKDGTVLQFFDTKVEPDGKELRAAIDKALADKPAEKPADKTKK